MILFQCQFFFDYQRPTSWCFSRPAAPRLDSGGPGECGGSRHRHGTARRGVAQGQAMAQKMAQSVGESKN